MDQAVREQILAAIDRWAATQLPRPCAGARLHTETLASVLDRIAHAHAQAWQALTTRERRDPQIHAAWERLSQTLGGYADLNEEITAGRRRLPTRR
ncbi:DUF4254 domain-containing protein [Nocardia cyriacigeorgica]|uniref:DUF4254 domain-containing protein n=1 Tax=Nocardia cyriacigeorgica TaxID=135487 RepID=UPI003D783D44